MSKKPNKLILIAGTFFSILFFADAAKAGFTLNGSDLSGQTTDRQSQSQSKGLSKLVQTDI